MIIRERDELLRDPAVLAIAVWVNRIRDLPREDRNDLFELAEALARAETNEEYDAAMAGMLEILKQSDGGLRVLAPQEPCAELGKWMDYVGGRIKHFREKAGLTQKELAKKAGLPQSHISRLERGRHSPSSMTVQRIASALEIASSELDPSV